ncbi:MAG: proprotein convertase P-domain-containing protein [Luteolibacter sp.]
MKPFFILCVLFPVAANAASTTFTQTWNISTAIPDNDDVGFTDMRTVSAPEITEIESMTVNLTLSGGWNGDLFAYLVHDSGFSVLLNRVGKDSANPDGAGSSGLNITFSEGASSDVHTTIPLTGIMVSGNYQPDGRTTDPLFVDSGDARTAMLGSFTGLDANGIWTLFIADQAAGDTSTLESWSLSITGVPEPTTALLGGLGMLLLFRRKKSSRSIPPVTKNF